MDRRFTCDCSGTKFTGDNCEEALDDSQDDTATVIIGVVLGVVLVLGVITVIYLKHAKYKKSMKAVDFMTQLQIMRDEGWVDESDTGGVPRELKRAGLSLIEKLGGRRVPSRPHLDLNLPRFPLLLPDPRSLMGSC